MLSDKLIKPCCCWVTGWLTGSDRGDSGACCGIDPEKGVSNGQLRLHTQTLIIYASSDWHTHTPQPCTGLPLGVKMVWGMPCPGCDLTTFHRSKVTCANVSTCIKGSSIEISQTCTLYRSLFLVIADINTLLSFTFITDILCIPNVFQAKIKVKHKQHLKLCAYVNKTKHKDRFKNTSSSWKHCWLCFSTH